MVDEAGLGVVFYNGIGDAILALPALRAIARSVGNFRLVCPAAAPYQCIFSEFTKNVTVCQINLAESFAPQELWDLLGRPPRVVFLTTWRNLSFKKWEEFAHGRILTYGPIERPNHESGSSPKHYFDAYMELVSPVIGDSNLGDYTYKHQAAGVNTIPAFALKLADQLSSPWVLHTETRREKMLNKSVWDAMTSLLLSNTTSDIVFVGHHDVPKVHRDSGRVFQSRRHFPLCAHLISRASIFIGVDSCFLHYADLQGTPCVGIFKTTDPAYWGPRLSAKRAVIQTDGDAWLNVRNCYNVACALLSRGG